MAYNVKKTSSHLVNITSKDINAYYDNENLSIFLNSPQESLGEKERQISSHSLPELITKSPLPENLKRKKIYRLSLNVTDTCNLSCRYCYAGHGNYGQSLLPRENWLDILVQVVKYYAEIDLILFFGGEPLLGIEKIQTACIFFAEAAKNGILNKTPRFALVTNGVLLRNKEIVSLLLKYEIAVTVSIDGPKSINNYLRFPKHSIKNNLYTYEAVIHGIKSAQISGVPISIESTYTNYHQKCNCSVINIIDTITEEFDIQSVHVTPACYSNWGDLRPEIFIATEDFFQASRLSVFRVKKQENGVLESTLNILNMLSKRERSNEYCPAFSSQISINLNGDLYPCFLAMSDSNLNFGNIVRDIWPTRAGIKILKKYYSDLQNSDFSKRHRVWYDSLFNGCSIADWLTFGKFGQDAFSEIHEAIITGTIIGLSEINDIDIENQLNIL